MLEIIPFEEKYIVGFRLDGKIDQLDFDQAVAAIEAALTADRKIRIYAEVTTLGGMSAETFMKNLRFKFQLFQDLSQFEKEAIVSDKKVVETLTSIGDKLFPSIEARHFSFVDKERLWLGLKINHD